MVKNLKKTPIIHIIKQILIKQKYVFKLIRYKSINEINLLEFLWINKYIFGFFLKKSINTHKNTIIIYLKIDKSINNLLYIKLNTFKTQKKLKKTKKWFKNSFFIIITTKGILSIQKSINYKIGGFILCQLY